MPIEPAVAIVERFLSKDFTPNSARAVWIQGELNQSLLNRVEPEIQAFTGQSTDPITLFIDSTGGSTVVCQRILNLLSSCRIITVACQRAVSAAADLLSSGDLAIALPGSRLLYHGTIIDSPKPITSEWASSLAAALRKSNRNATGRLIRSSTQRFGFIFSALRHFFWEYRAKVGKPALTDIECLDGLLREKLTSVGNRVLNRAITRWETYRELIVAFQDELELASVGHTDFERTMLTACIEFEWRTNGFDLEMSLNRIGDNYAFLDTCFQKRDCVQGSEFLEYCFFATVCRALQEGDYELTPTDALWLGLIDTIRTDISPENL